MLTWPLKAKPFKMAPQLTSTLITLLGIVIIVMAIFSYLTELPLQAIVRWLQRMFSVVFVVIFSLLIGMAILAVVQLKQPKQAEYWHEVGQQAGNGIATLALTFTLLGISLGIGTLAEQPLTPENVQLMISDLTRQFSMAFMTTVVGLPAAAIVRAFVSIKYQRTKLTLKEHS